MNWVETLNRAIDYIEGNLLDDISISEIARYVYISNEHLQRGFSALADLTIGEYIRNRRLSLAGLELTHKDVRVIDIAIKYGYDTSESFSKAFNRFHGFAPSIAKQNNTNLKSYSRLTVKIIMEGGSVMDYSIVVREAFEVVAKVDELAAEFSEKQTLLSSWSVSGKGAQLFENFLHIVGERGIDGKITCKTYSHSRETPNGELPDGYEVWQVPEYTWAVFKCVGETPQAAVDEIWKRIYSEWLPQAKYEVLQSVSSQVVFQGTQSSPGDGEIWLPVKKK